MADSAQPKAVTRFGFRLVLITFLLVAGCYRAISPWTITATPRGPDSVLVLESVEPVSRKLTILCEGLRLEQGERHVFAGSPSQLRKIGPTTVFLDHSRRRGHVLHVLYKGHTVEVGSGEFIVDGNGLAPGSSVVWK